MRQYIWFVLFLMPFSVVSQDKSKGVNFERNFTWDAIREKATEESKYIFVDCYATWCGPCKEMEKLVYPRQKVGEIINSRFVSIKLQMDTTMEDDAEVRRLYSLAKKFREEYSIGALPTFLFFAPNGDLVHKDVGGKTTQKFIELATHATDTNNQVFSLVKRVRQGGLDYSLISKLAYKLKELQENELAIEMAKKYMNGYLDNLPDNEFLTKANLDFIRSFHKAVTVHDRIFSSYRQNSDIIDSIMSKNYSSERIRSTVTKDEVYPLILDAKANVTIPLWRKMYRQIKRKYGFDIAVNTVLVEKTVWYEQNMDWDNYCSALSKLIKAKGAGMVEYGWMYLNDKVWKVCVNSSNRRNLEMGLKLIDLAISSEPAAYNAATLDTKSMILYKLGRRDLAISIEREAINTLESTHPQDENKIPTINFYKNRVTQMINGDSILLE